MNGEKQYDHQPEKGKWLKKYNRFIVKNIPFYLFLALLAVIYIANGHSADKMLRQIGRTETAIKEMEYEYKTVKKDVIFRSKESELVQVVEPLGLKPLTVPPVYITDTLQKKKN